MTLVRWSTGRTPSISGIEASHSSTGVIAFIKGFPMPLLALTQPIQQRKRSHVLAAGGLDVDHRVEALRMQVARALLQGLEESPPCGHVGALERHQRALLNVP